MQRAAANQYCARRRGFQVIGSFWREAGRGVHELPPSRIRVVKRSEQLSVFGARADKGPTTAIMRPAFFSRLPWNDQHFGERPVVAQPPMSSRELQRTGVGGPGRTRTCDLTVMSGVFERGNRRKS